MTLTAVIIDSREPEWVQNLTFGGIPKTVNALDHGDLLGATADGSSILVERKTPDDLLGTIKEGRLFPQLADMLDKTRWAYLVITGELQRGANGNVITDRGNTGWSWHAVQGALITAQEMGIFVTFAGGDADYEACIQRISNRDRKPDLVLEPPKMPRILSAQESVIASLPGIGIERLQSVMKHCGTPAWALVGLTDPTTDIPNIPRNVKTKIRAALALKDTEQLGILTNEDGEEVVRIIPFGAQ